MEIWWSWGEALLRGIPSLLLNPFTYIVLFIMLLLYRRTIMVQRKLFGARLLTVAEGWLSTLFSGLLAGALLSMAMIGLGVVLSFETFLLLALILFMLSLFHLRFFQLHYAAVLLGLFVLCTPLLQGWLGSNGSSPFWQVVQGIDLPSLFAFVALLSLAGACLTYKGGWNRGTPVFIQGKRGRLVGGYQAAIMWFVPVFVIGDSLWLDIGGTASSTGLLAPFYNQWPLFASDVGMAAMSCILLPAVFTYTNTVVTSTPRQKSRQWAKMLTLFAIILLALSVASLYIPSLIIFTLAYALVGYEAMVFCSQWLEQKGSPIYVHTAQGLKILAVVPGSPANHMGLESGEVIKKINGQALRGRDDFFEALMLNKAFCKMEVIDARGEKKFVQRSLYEHEQHHLGILLAPDEKVSTYVPRDRLTLLNILGQKVKQEHMQVGPSQGRPLHQADELSRVNPLQQDGKVNQNN